MQITRHSGSYGGTTMNYNVTMVCAEVKPLCKKGGVADVVTDLSKALNDAGSTVNVITYMNKDLNEGLPLNCLQSAGTVSVALNGGTEKFIVWKVDASGPHSVYVLENDTYANRTDDVYPAARADPQKYGRKYAAFSKAAAELILTRDEFREGKSVVHCHDYQAALTAACLKTDPRYDALRENRPAVVQTVHNLGYGPRCDAFQGVYDAAVLDFVGLASLFHINALEYFGKANFLKGGVVFADATNCVSERYAEEVTQPHFGGGLEGVMVKAQNEGKLFGITNGIDTSYVHFRPDGGVSLPYGRGYRVSDAKAANRRHLNDLLRQQQYKLLDSDKQTIGVVARLSHQKFDVLLAEQGAYMRQILEMGVNVLLNAENGDKTDPLHRIVEDLDGRYKNLIWLNKERPLRDSRGERLGFDAMAQLNFASSDFLLNPAVYEPCGLTQLIAMMFGTIPIVSAPGGLRNTVIEHSAAHKKGNGFFIAPNTPDEMVRTVRRALHVAHPQGPHRKIITANC
ncbi:MAG: glycogen/starch synthase, partial [Nanoarchaeota archaeon]